MNWYRTYDICHNIYSEIAESTEKLQYSIDCFHAKLHEYRSALENLYHSLEICESIYKEALEKTDDIFYSSADPCYKSDRFEAAIENFKNTLDICTNIYGALHRIKEEIKFQLACSAPPIKLTIKS